jgi:hypothetical protein
MAEMDREVRLGYGEDLSAVGDPRFRDRLLMVDEMEETALAIRSKAAGFDTVAEEQVERLEGALRALRADLARRGGIMLADAPAEAWEITED